MTTASTSVRNGTTMTSTTMIRTSRVCTTTTTTTSSAKSTAPSAAPPSYRNYFHLLHLQPPARPVPPP
eukprot:9325772-Pyramimonas_sp.AAC.1